MLFAPRSARAPDSGANSRRCDDGIPSEVAQKGYCVRCAGPTTHRGDDGTGRRHRLSVASRVGMGRRSGNRSRSVRSVRTIRTERPRMSFARTVRMFALVAVIALVGTACRADWSQWGGGTERIGASRFEIRDLDRQRVATPPPLVGRPRWLHQRRADRGREHAGARRQPRRALRRHRAGRVLRSDHRRTGRVAPQPRDARGELPRHARQHLRRPGVRGLRPARRTASTRWAAPATCTRWTRSPARSCRAGRCRSTPTPRTTRCTARPTSSTVSSTSRPGATATSSRTTAT